MPGATSKYGIDYAVGSDPLGDGDNSMQDLAEAVEETLDALHMTVVKTTDEVVNGSSVYQSDDELTFPVEANSMYIVDFVVIWRATELVVSGIKTRWSLPVDNVGVWGWARTEDQSATGSLGGGESRNTTTPDHGIPLLILASNMGNGTAAGNEIALYGQHRIETGPTAGTATIQWAQDVSNASNLTVVAGSWLKVEKVY